MRIAVTIEFSAKERLKLESLTKGRSSSLRARLRAAIILLAADGLENQEIAARLGQDKMMVSRWRQRYATGGLAAILKDKSRPGRIPPVPAALISKISAAHVSRGRKDRRPWEDHLSSCSGLGRVLERYSADGVHLSVCLAATTKGFPGLINR